MHGEEFFHPQPKKDILSLPDKYREFVAHIIHAERSSKSDYSGPIEYEYYDNPISPTGYKDGTSLSYLGQTLDDSSETELGQLGIHVSGSRFSFTGAEGQYQEGLPIKPQLVITHTQLKDNPSSVWRFINDSPRNDDPTARRGDTRFSLIFDEEMGRNIEQISLTDLDLPDFLEQAYSCLFEIKVAGQRLWQKAPEIWMPVVVVEKDKNGIVKAGLQAKMSDELTKPASVWIWKREDNRIHYAK